MYFTNNQLKNAASYIHAVEVGWTDGIDKYKSSLDDVLSFSTREEYLQWVTAWKEQYVDITKEIRHAKKSRKLSSPTYYIDAPKDALWYREQARTMLFIRQQGKSKSWQTRNERRAKEQATKA